MITAQQARTIQENGRLGVAIKDYEAKIEKEIRLSASYGFNRIEWKIDKTDTVLSMILDVIVDDLNKNGFTAYIVKLETSDYKEDVLIISWY